MDTCSPTFATSIEPNSPLLFILPCPQAALVSELSRAAAPDQRSLRNLAQSSSRLRIHAQSAPGPGRIVKISRPGAAWKWIFEL
jgi:hypothetical protein